MEIGNSTRVVRFGSFEVDLQTGELRKSGIRIHLQEQPFRVLAIILERPGELVSRDELKQRLWRDLAFGDFDQAITVAVKKLRLALGDDADNPRFIETLPRRGYRFIAPVSRDASGTSLAEAEAAAKSVAPPGIRSKAPKGFRRLTNLILAGIILALVVIASFFLTRPHLRSLGVTTSYSEFRLMPLTGSLGFEMQPQFSPDGKEIAYAWSSGKEHLPDIYVKLLDGGGPVRLMAAQDRVGRLLPTWSPDGRYIAFLQFRLSPEPKSNPKESAAEQVEKKIAAPLAVAFTWFRPSEDRKKSSSMSMTSMSFAGRPQAAGFY